MYSYCEILTSSIFYSLSISENVYFKFFKGNNSIELASIYRQNMKNVYSIKVRYIIMAETILK